MIGVFFNTHNTWRILLDLFGLVFSVDKGGFFFLNEICGAKTSVVKSNARAFQHDLFNIQDGILPVISRLITPLIARGYNRRYPFIRPFIGAITHVEMR